ncbi:MAG: 30S ribosome-binding factor RbfA [Paludibacteraceae bacterium]|jgi:ribosome-binding factor A|nr:30S ribosome-binding factor RbfA [Paludibacteraceae bacterium]
MESTRQHKVSRLIQKDLSDILLRYARSLSGTLISVSEVRVSPDLAIAHVYLSIFPQDRMESTLSKVNEDKGKIRGEMGRLERHQLRIIPELHFHLDDTINRMERIDTLLQS